MKIILASKSPRRKELLKQAGYDFEVCPANFDEISGTAKNAEEIVSFNAKGKCLEIVNKIGDKNPILGADTVVVIDGKIIGKPKDAKDAKKTLQNLSGRSHEVLTGITVAYCGKILSNVSKTTVYFKKLTDEQIDKYVATGEPLDKAGSYGIQDGAAFMVDHIVGNYDTVVGLDIEMLKEMLEKLKVN